jgi:hypothetical protein
MCSCVAPTSILPVFILLSYGDRYIYETIMSGRPPPEAAFDARKLSSEVYALRENGNKNIYLECSRLFQKYG